MSPASGSQVSVRILDRDYQVACPPEERDSLIKAADYLNRRMLEIRDSGRVVGVDRIAVMVALNLAHQFLEADSGKDALAGEAAHRVERLRLALLEATGNDVAA